MSRRALFGLRQGRPAEASPRPSEASKPTQANVVEASGPVQPAT